MFLQDRNYSTGQKSFDSSEIILQFRNHFTVQKSLYKTELLLQDRNHWVLYIIQVFPILELDGNILCGYNKIYFHRTDLILQTKSTLYDRNYSTGQQ